jgi:hypothetical protein
MILFYDWIAKESLADHPWCVLGKGPTFSKHSEFPDLDVDYRTMGLNHVCRERKTFVTHVIDANVLDEVPELSSRTKYLVMPMHPHFQFKATKRTLEEMSTSHPVVRDFESRGNLLWYNLSTWPKARGQSSVVKVAFFSAEAAIQLLSRSGVRKIRTLGVDGGTSYAQQFKDIKAFKGGHTTFDIQTRYIEATVKDFKIDFGPLWNAPL